MAVTRPIWQDTYYTTTAETLNYSITLGGEVIFNGRAYRMPDAESIRININKICQNYLSSSIQPLLDDPDEEQIVHDEAYRTFVLVNSSGSTLQTYNFRYDWSYRGWNGENVSLSEPINGHIAAGMYPINTWFTSGRVISDNYSGSYPVQACGDYALYYLNAMGGWDAFLIEGGVIRTDTVKQYTLNRSFDNNTIEFESGRYLSENTISYKMTTGWLSDAEAARLAENLLESNTVYIHDLKADRITPAVITDTSVVFKTFRNQGKKMVNYTISIKESQIKIRK